MLVNIIKNFDTPGRRWLAGQNVDVDEAIARKWIADGYATRDTDGVQNPLVDPATGQVVGGGGAFQGASIAPKTTQSVAANLPKFKAALQLTAQRKKPTIVLFLGDSTEANFGGNTGTNGWVGASKMTHARQVASLLGWSDSGAVGCGCTNDVPLGQYDERVGSIGAGISQLGNVSALGGGWVSFAAGATGSYSITPRGRNGYDRVRIVYGRYATGGASSMSVTVGGSSIGTFSAQGGSGLGDTQSVEFSCAYSSPSVPISIQGNGGATDGTCLIIAVIWYDSSNPGVIVLNGGTSGMKAGDLLNTSNPWTARASIPVIAPDLCPLNMWINDTNFVTDPASYRSALDSVKTYLSTTADIVYIGYQPINSAQMSNGQGDAIFAAMQSVAGTAPVLDLRASLGQTYADANALGIFYDTLHINSKGQYYKACYTASAIAP